MKINKSKISSIRHDFKNLIRRQGLIMEEVFHQIEECKSLDKSVKLDMEKTLGSISLNWNNLVGIIEEKK